MHQSPVHVVSFGITALLLCVGAGFCANWFKAKTLAEPVQKVDVATASKNSSAFLAVARRLDYRFSFRWDISVKNGQASAGVFKYGGSGCGAGNHKCSCNNPHGKFLMAGQGTSGTATGLEFMCENVQFTFKNARDPDRSKVTCNFHIDMPYSIFSITTNNLKADCTPDWLAMIYRDQIFYDDETDLDFPAVDNEKNWKGVSPWCDACDLGSLVIDLKPQYRLPPLPDYTESTGSWELVGSGGTFAFEESVESSRTLSRADASSVANSIAVSAQWEKSIMGSKLTLGAQYTNAWTDTITKTFSDTDGTATRTLCTTVTCPGAIYQWNIRSTSNDAAAGPPVTVKTCHFVCQESTAPIHSPQCPLGWCNRNYFGDQHHLHGKSKVFQCPCCLEPFQETDSECSYQPKSREPWLSAPYTKRERDINHYVINPDHEVR